MDKFLTKDTTIMNERIATNIHVRDAYECINKLRSYNLKKYKKKYKKNIKKKYKKN